MNNKKCLYALCAFGFAVVASVAEAHHSFAIYDIDNKIERTGVLTRFDFIQPHILLQLDVTDANGEKETWKIESMAPRRWDSFELDRAFASVGDEVTIRGWPARNGNDEMVLSTMIGDKGVMVVRDEIRQRSARENLPEETIRRD